MRAGAKLQVAGVLLGGFFIGYVLFYLFPWSSEPPRAIHFTEDGRDFVVAGRRKLIMSGAIHYFRVVPEYWEDRLLKLKAAGLNTVETYVPWNLHEPSPGSYDFSGILDIREFVLTAQNLGLHVIVRPGPYICSEWDFGGLPAWLLHDPHMVLRSMYPGYIHAVQKYFRKLFEILIPLQYSRGGPIIAFQIENELADYLYHDRTGGLEYMQSLHKLMINLGVNELLFTSDGQPAINRSIYLRPASNILMTVNFMNEHRSLIDLKRLQPDKPLMVMEFWTGWFDKWGEEHSDRGLTAKEQAEATTSFIRRRVSFNYYMFHGGTNFGFTSGASWLDKGTKYVPTITSYDYKAPISECGDITPKYKAIREVLRNLAPESLPVFPLPPIPSDLPKKDYGEVKLSLYIPLQETMQYIPDPFVSSKPIPMEYLPVNGGSGQGSGYVLYRTSIPPNAHQITVNGLRDYGVAMLNLKPVKKLSYFQKQSFLLPSTEDKVKDKLLLDILVENAGRVNHAHPLEVRKGISGEVSVDGVVLNHWKIYSFEFKSSYIENIDSGGKWQRTPTPLGVGPALYKGTFNIQEKPCDTFADMKGWGKGILIINGINLGRYWTIGPQRTLYVPAPILRQGVNKVMIFEFDQPRTPQTVVLRNTPILDDTPQS